MLRRIRMKQLPVFLKILLSFLTVIIPFYVISIWNNTAGQESVREEVVKALQSQVKHFNDQMEMDFAKIINMQKEFIKDSDISKLATMTSELSEYERFQAMINVQKRIELFKNSSSFVTGAVVHILATGQNVYSYFDEDINKIYEYISDGSQRDNPTMLVYYQDALFLNLLHSAVPSGNEKPPFTMVSQFSIADIVKQLNKFVISDRSGAVFMDINGEWVIAGGEKNLRTQVIEHVKKIPGLEDEKGIYYINVHDERFFLVFETSEYLNTSLLCYFPESVILGKLQAYNTRYLMSTLFTIVIVVIFSMWIYSLVAKPMDKLVVSFKALEKGDLTTYITHNRTDDLGFVYDRFNRMVDRLKKLISDVYEEKIHTQRAELKQLQYQINPHFLYNSLFIIHLMAMQKDFENITVFSNHLREYYQYLTCGNNSQITLEEEYRHARNYIEIQSLRFQGTIRVMMEDIPTGYHKLIVPRLIIQPILENAYEHGLKKVSSGGVLQVTMKKDEKYLNIIVEDSGWGIPDENIAMLEEYLNMEDEKESISKSKGLFNVHRRLSIHFGGESGLKVMRSELGGLKVQMRIQCEGRENSV